jgi:peptide/nickel transport system permease protein
MAGFLLRRLASSLVLLFLVLTLTFFLVRLAPGSPFSQLTQDASRISPEALERLRALYGLDRPLLEQYFTWLGAALQGDFGVSYRLQQPALLVLLHALPSTLVLAVAALLVGYLVALPMGVFAARRRGSAWDHGIRIGALLIYSLPLFWVALVALLLVAYVIPILPAGHAHSVGADDLPGPLWLLDFLHHLALPALVLGLAIAAGTTRFVRNSLLEVLQEPYLVTARAKGLAERRVIWRHGVRTALAPLLQLLGLTLPALLNGSVLIEVIFSWPGLGRVTYDALLTRDYPLILAAVALSATFVILGNLLADLLHALADPRVRDGSRG